MHSIRKCGHFSQESHRSHMLHAFLQAFLSCQQDFKQELEAAPHHSTAGHCWSSVQHQSCFTLTLADLSEGSSKNPEGTWQGLLFQQSGHLLERVLQLLLSGDFTGWTALLNLQMTVVFTHSLTCTSGTQPGHTPNCRAAVLRIFACTGHMARARAVYNLHDLLHVQQCDAQKRVLQ